MAVARSRWHGHVWTHVFARSLVPLLITATVAAGPGPALQGQPLPPTGSDTGILLIAGEDPVQPYVQEIYQGFREVLEARAPHAILFREFFDIVRFGDRPTHAAEFQRWLEDKYRDKQIDVIVATAEPTLQVLASRDGNPWNDVPIVYGTLGDLTADIRRTHPTASGIVLEDPLPRLLAVIRAMVPDTSRIALVGGASQAERRRDARYLDDIRREGLGIVDLGGLKIDEIVQRVATLPTGTIPVLVGFQVDGSGRTFQSDQAVRLIVRTSSQPSFSIASTDIGNGVVGGVIFDARMVGRELATAALDRLNGSPGASITIPASKHASAVFDARELDRWGIAEKRLPAGSTVLFRTPSLWRDYRRTVIAAVAFGALQTLLIMAILIQRRHRARVQAALADSYAQLRRLTNRLITAQEEERSRIARNLHDDMGQRVAALSIGLSGLKRQAADAAPVGDAISALQRQAVGLAGDLRDLSHELHPGILEHLGLVEALKACCEEFEAETTGVRARLVVSHTWREVSAEIALCLYRVVQEALRNVARHAGAHNVVITLDRSDGTVLLQVADDGQGFDQTVRKRGLGLLSVTERVELIGGRVDVRSARGAGTTLAVTLPESMAHAA